MFGIQSRRNMQLLILLFITIIIIIIEFAVPTSINYINSNVIEELSIKTYESKIYKSKQLWIIKYCYDDDLNQNQSLIHNQNEVHYKHLAQMFNGLIRVATINCPIKHYFCKQNGIHIHYEPLLGSIIKFYNIQSNTFTSYYGNHQLNNMVEATIISIKRRFKYKLSQKEKQFKQIIINLSDLTFDEYVLYNSDHAWLVLFYSSNWGSFKNIFSIYERIARELQVKEHNILCGALNIEFETDKASEYNVTSSAMGPPVLKYFTRGIKNGFVDMDATYVNADLYLDRYKLLVWIHNLHDKTIETPIVYQMIDEQAFKKACNEQTHDLCIATVLPSFVKCNVECRHSYLDTLYSVAKLLKRNRWGWLWFTIGTQPNFERLLTVNIKSNKPQMFVLDIKQKIFWPNNTFLIIERFLKEDILNFLNNIDKDFTNTSNFTTQILELPRIYKYQIWDGENEEISFEMGNLINDSSKYTQHNIKNIDEL